MAGFTKLTRTGNSYADIDNMPDELIEVELDVDKKTGTAKGYKKPAKKKWKIERNGIEFDVSSKLQKALNTIWEDRHPFVDDEEDDFTEEDYRTSYYDPQTLLRLCEEYDIPAEGYTHEGTGIFIDGPISALFTTSAGFIEKKTIDINIEDTYSLDDAIVDKRIRAFVHILMRCHDEDVVKEIVARATKKKNGSLHKGRLQTIAHMDLVDEDGETYVVVAKNDSDTKISLEVRQKGVNTTWLGDPDLFTSTKLFFGE